MSISILLAIDHPIIRSSLRLILEREAEFRVVAEAANGREAVLLAEYKQPKVVVLDVALPHVNGVTAAREISARRPEIRILFVSALSEETYLFEAFKAGAAAYVAAEEAPYELVRAIRRTLEGYEFISPSLSRKIVAECSSESALRRELLALTAAAYSPNELAAELKLDALESRMIAENALVSGRVPPGVAERIARNLRLSSSAASR